MSNAGRTSTVPAVSRQKPNAELCRFLQFNDRKMFAPGHVADRQVEALAASAPDRCAGPASLRTRFRVKIESFN